MFFRLTNSPTIFQIMMNKILWNLINTRKVESFINNFIVEIEEKERHNEVMEKIIEKLVKSNLYVKLQKCK